MKGPEKMNKHSPIKPPASLLERANELYDFGAALRGPAKDATPVEPPASPLLNPKLLKHRPLRLPRPLRHLLCRNPLCVRLLAVPNSASISIAMHCVPPIILIQKVQSQACLKNSASSNASFCWLRAAARVSMPLNMANAF